MICNTTETVSITPNPCLSHFCCWLLPIWPKLDFWAENGAYSMCRLGWRYNGANLSFSWPYIKVSIILNTSETACITPQPCHSHFCCWLLPIWHKLNFWAENGAYGLYRLGWRYNGEKLYFPWPYMIVSMIYNTSETFSITRNPCHIE